MSLRTSLSFFTRLPVGNVYQDNARKAPATSLAGLVAYLPTVGIIVGLCVGLLLWLFSAIFPPTLAGILGALSWVFITGGLHLDGLADCADAFVVEAPKERRLIIMKDPNVGTFASIAIFFILAIKVTTLTLFVHLFFIKTDSYTALLGILILCLIGSLARAMVFVAHRLPNAREHEKNQGLGKAVMQDLTQSSKRKNCILICTVVSVTYVYAKLFSTSNLPTYTISIACISVVITTFMLMRKARKSIGGVTGDVYGCTIELCECAGLLSFCLI